MTKFLLLLSLLCIANSQFLNFLVDEAVTQKVWDHHIASWGAKDLDAILSDYDESAFVIVNNNVFQGHDQIKSVFTQLFELFSHGNNQIHPAVVKAQTIYITWRFTPDGFGAFVGTDSFVVIDGKIQAQTIASELYEMFPIKY